jgi:drug/metabolite transporter (DMT)-like permease
MTETKSHPLRGYWLVASAALLWGASGVIARYLLGKQSLNPFDVLLLRTALAGLVCVIWFQMTAPQVLRLTRADWRHDGWRLALFGIIGLAAQQACYYLALQRVAVGYALLMQYTMPLMVMAYGVTTRTEKMTGAKLLAAALTLAGSALMMGGQTESETGASLSGTLFALASAAGFAFYSVLSKGLMRRHDARTVVTYGFLTSVLTWLIVHPLWTMQWSRLDGRAWTLIVFVAMTGTVLPFVLYLAGLRHLDASRAGLTATLEPVFAAVLAWLLLGELMLFWQIAGGLAVLGGVLLIQAEGRRE